MIIIFWSTTGWYCCPVYYSLHNTGLGDCSLTCGVAQPNASNILWNTDLNGHYRHMFILFKHDKLWRPKIKVRWVDHIPCPYLNADVVDVSLSASFFAYFCDNWSMAKHVYFDITESCRFSLSNYNFGERYSFAMRLYGISVDFHNYPATPPVPWNIFILFGTNRYTSHLLCQLYFCTIFQGRHWPTVHEKIRLVHQICSSVQTNI